jgi:hypothetical protein
LRSHAGDREAGGIHDAGREFPGRLSGVGTAIPTPERSSDVDSSSVRRTAASRDHRAVTALPEIPVLDVGVDWPFEILEGQLDRINALLDESGGRIPKLAIRMGDAISRLWLKRWHPFYLEEIDRISARITRPGAYFLNLSYEWGCTSSAGPSPDGLSSRLIRVLDWPDRGLGRYIVAARVKADAGPWLTLTWPGYTGVLQAVAPARFAAALNQAPMERPVGVYLADWVVNRLRIWKQPHLTPAHLLRQVFERASCFAEAKAMLSETPIALPTIYILAGSSLMRHALSSGWQTDFM